MSGNKRSNAPRGRGYLPKGGVPAAQAHNERVREVARPSSSPDSGADGRADVRGSARPFGRHPERVAWTIGSSLGSASFLALLLDALGVIGRG